MPNQRRLLNQFENVFSEMGSSAQGGPGTPGDGASGSSLLDSAGPGAPVNPQGIVPGWAWETDTQSRYVRCAPEILTLLGYEPAALLGQPLTEIGVPADSAGRRELTSAIKAQRPLFDLRLEASTPGGLSRIIVLNALPLFDADDHFQGYRGVAYVLLPTGALAAIAHPPAPAAAAPAATPAVLAGTQPLPTQATGLAKPAAKAASAYSAASRAQPVWQYLADASGVAPQSNWTTPELEVALKSGKLVIGGAENGPAGDGTAAAPGGHKSMGVPIRLQNQTIGAFDFHDEAAGGGWSEDDLALVQAVTDQLALAVENVRLFDETREYLDKQTVLYEVTNAAASAASLGEALNSAAEALGRMLPDSNIAILLLDSERRTLRIRAAAGFPAGLGDQFSIPLGGGVTGWAAANNQAVMLGDVRVDSRYVAGAAGMLSEAAVPLALADRVIGVLNVESPRLGAFDEQDMQLFSTLAGTLSAIIVNNNLLADITRERERLAVLYDVLQSLLSGPDRQSIFDTALELAARLGAQHAYLLLLGDRREEAIFLSTLPGLNRLSSREANAYALTVAEAGLEQWVLANGRAAVVADTRRDSRWYTAPQHADNEPARAVISVPLTTKRGALRGVLGYTHSLPGALGEEQLPLIESIAGQVAVALENDELRRQQSLQSASAESLARAAQALTRSLQETELQQIVVDQLFAAFQADGVMMLRWEPASQTFLPLAAALSPVEQKRSWPAVGESFSVSQRPDLLDILHNRQPRRTALRDEPGGRRRESVTLPVLYGGEVEGVVELIHTTTTTGLNPTELELFQSILTAAASAFQSARLYELQRQTAERLAEVDRLKSQFLANMSHELRTPLNSIIGFSRVILKGIDGPLSELQGQDLTSINNAGQHLLGLINDILDMARIEAGKMELVFDEVDLQDTIKGVMSTTVALIKDKPVRLVQDVLPTLPRVRADSMRVRQVLLNLLANAAKFTDEGSITLRARAVEAISPASGVLEPFVEIGVTDTGPGIAPEDMDKLFEPFSQVDASATRKAGGTGLGLSICRQLVELHNGRIWAESELGTGSTFSFILPVGQLEAPAPVVEMPAEPEPAPAPMVLAIDDDPGVLNLYKRYLEPHGYRVIGITKSTEAISRAAELRPLVVLLDVLMPNKDGWQVLAELKRSSLTRDIPVIMCTLVSEPKRAAGMGASGYLTKPILETDLVLALQRLPPPVMTGATVEVLVIDDQPEAVDFIRRALAGPGAPDYVVTHADGGAAGLEAARQRRPGAIILDLMLPDMDGYEVLAELRDDPATRNIPVLIVTGAELSARDRQRLTRQVSVLRDKGLLKEDQLLQDLQSALGLKV